MTVESLLWLPQWFCVTVRIASMIRHHYLISAAVLRYAKHYRTVSILSVCGYLLFTPWCCILSVRFCVVISLLIEAATMHAYKALERRIKLLTRNPKPYPQP